MHVMWPRYSAYSYIINVAHLTYHSAVGTTFDVISYDAVRAVEQTHHLPDAEELRYLLCHGRRLLLKKQDS